MHFSGILLLAFATHAFAEPAVEATWWVNAYKDMATCDKPGKVTEERHSVKADCHTWGQTAGALRVGLPNLPGYKMVAYSEKNCEGTKLLTTTSISQNCQGAKGIKSIRVSL